MMHHESPSKDSSEKDADDSNLTDQQEAAMKSTAATGPASGEALVEDNNSIPSSLIDEKVTSDGGSSSSLDATKKDSSIRPNMALSGHGQDLARRINDNFMPLFTHPQQRQRWGDTQLHPHTNWGDIFFDLFYVAAAYNLGNLLKADPTPRGLLYLIGCFLPIMSIWSTKMFYDCRFFVGNDLWHRCLEVTKLLCLATAVWSIRDVEIMSHPSDYPDMFHYCAGISAAMIIVQIRYVEILWCQWVGRDGLYPEAFYTARRELIWTSLQLVFYVAATVYAASMYFDKSRAEGIALVDNIKSSPLNAATNGTTNGEATDTSAENDHRYLASENSSASDTTDDTPVILCLAGNLFGQLFFTFLVVVFMTPEFRKIPIRSITVPMHIEYAIHRYGEWTMLMLGESILSLLIVDVVDSDDYYGVFFAGIIAIAFLQSVHFSSQPHNPDEHAMRRSRYSGILVNYTFQVYSISLVVLGTTYKMFLSEVVSHSEDTSSRYRLLGDVAGRWLAEGASKLPADVSQQNTANLFSGSMACIWFCQDIMLLAHRGLKDNFHRGVACTMFWRSVSATFVLVRLGLIVFFATLSQYETDPTRLAAIGCAGVILQFITRAVGSTVFPNLDNHEQVEAFRLESGDELCTAPE